MTGETKESERKGVGRVLNGEKDEGRGEERRA